MSSALSSRAQYNARTEATHPLLPRRPPPASISLVISHHQLVAEEGATLLLSFQLKDSRNRTGVDATGITLRPVIDLNGTVHPLANCEPLTVDPASGIGECAVLVGQQLFPPPGSAPATAAVQLQLQLG